MSESRTIHSLKTCGFHMVKLIINPEFTHYHHSILPRTEGRLSLLSTTKPSFIQKTSICTVRVNIRNSDAQRPASPYRWFLNSQRKHNTHLERVNSRMLLSDPFSRFIICSHASTSFHPCCYYNTGQVVRHVVEHART